MPHAIRIFAADRRPLMIQGLARVIAEAPDLRLTAHSNRQDDLERALAGHPRVDLIVLDPGLYAHDPADAVQSIRRLPCAAAILLTITHIDDSLLLALGHENVSCIPADSDTTTILAAIRSLHSGRPNLPHEVQHAFARRFLRPLATSGALTDRERHILALAADGLSARAIATKLNISQSTAKTHLRRAYAKLEATNRSSAITTAIRSGALYSTHGRHNGTHAYQSTS